MDSSITITITSLEFTSSSVIDIKTTNSITISESFLSSSSTNLDLISTSLTSPISSTSITYLELTSSYPTKISETYLTTTISTLSITMNSKMDSSIYIASSSVEYVTTNVIFLKTTYIISVVDSSSSSIFTSSKYISTSFLFPIKSISSSYIQSTSSYASIITESNFKTEILTSFTTSISIIDSVKKSTLTLIDYFSEEVIEIKTILSSKITDSFSSKIMTSSEFLSTTFSLSTSSISITISYSSIYLETNLKSEILTLFKTTVSNIDSSINVALTSIEYFTTKVIEIKTTNTIMIRDSTSRNIVTSSFQSSSLSPTLSFTNLLTTSSN